MSLGVKKNQQKFPARFLAAKPVWPRGKEKEQNLLVGFRTVVSNRLYRQPVLRIAASSLYRCFLNGAFLGHGPARAAHGFYRIDEWLLNSECEEYVIAIEVAGYNIDSYYLLNQPSFLQAEIVFESEVLAATGDDSQSFQAVILNHRIQKVPRYSTQRTFSEAYRIRSGHDEWRRRVSVILPSAECDCLLEKPLIRRGVPYPLFNLQRSSRFVLAGSLDFGVASTAALSDSHDASERNPGREKDEDAPFVKLRHLINAGVERVNNVPCRAEPVVLTDRQFRIADFQRNLTGFIGVKVKTNVRSHLLITFDELLIDNDVRFDRLGCCNVISYELEPGQYELEALEPYTFRYLKLIVLEGECGIEDVYVREYQSDSAYEARFLSDDPQLNLLFEAARHTYSQNAVDLFMDCPSRERAGWLCDSFFMARAAAYLTRDTFLERNQFENYLLPGSFPSLPRGMLPMCYPADHPRGIFIPSWALWFVIQLEEYLDRSGDREMVDALASKVFALLEYLGKYRNEDGLLEKLEGWVFVEWSKANEFVQDINYPNNMVYAAALGAAGRLFGRDDLVRSSAELRETIRAQSFDGEFFIDNAMRIDGKVVRTSNRTEVCQYYAFFFDIAQRETHSALWETLANQFGPHRQKSEDAFPQIHLANAFIGNILRMQLFSRFGLHRQLLKECWDYYGKMAQTTGTLWEHDSPLASCNHGFASYVSYILFENALGLCRIDHQSRTIHLAFNDCGLDSCQGQVPVDDGLFILAWRREGEVVFYDYRLPSGFSISIANSNSSVRHTALLEKGGN